MKISTKGEYGIRAMLYIAMHCDRRSVTSHEIALQQGIPEPYLRQILAVLSKERLILSNRGPQGGHVLGRPAAAISVRDILLPLEGQTTSIDQILALPCTIQVGTDHCAIREVFLEVKEAVERILSTTTLEDIGRRQREILRDQISVPHDLPAYSHTSHPLLPILPPMAD
ncbi:MAG TPA: Rrf2 family transcriptional regulator [Thermoanaerobaculia bacterium]|jgi:Rrf2 family protein|nr:Rrf2 family transcriptional regulator [Thermoanaerobaculia bacterium]